MQDELIIEPGRSFKHYWSDLWRYRELFYILAWRDVAVRYKQTVAGAAWAVICPFLTMLSYKPQLGTVSFAGFRCDADCKLSLITAL